MRYYLGCTICVLDDEDVTFEMLENFLLEGTMMIDFKHENVLSLIGIIYERGERPLVVLPLMENGDLHSFIKRDDIVSDPSAIPSEFLFNFSVYTYLFIHICMCIHM